GNDRVRHAAADQLAAHDAMHHAEDDVRAGRANVAYRPLDGDEVGVFGVVADRVGDLVEPVVAGCLGAERGERAVGVGDAGRGDRQVEAEYVRAVRHAVTASGRSLAGSK